MAPPLSQTCANAFDGLPFATFSAQDSGFTLPDRFGVCRYRAGRERTARLRVCRYLPTRSGPYQDHPAIEYPQPAGHLARSVLSADRAYRPRGAKRVAPPDNNSDLRPLEHRRQHGSEGAHISEGAHTHSRGKRPLRSWRIARSACSTPRPSQCRQVIVRVDMPRHRSAAPVIYYICLYSSYTYTPRRWGGLLTVYLVL